MKKSLVVIVSLLLVLICAIPIYAEFEIEDPVLLDVMKQYDLNNDGIIALNEFNSVMLSEGGTLVLDGNRFSSAKGLEKTYFANKIFMRNCGFSKLPDGIEAITSKELHLENNELIDSEELLTLLKIRSEFKKYIYIAGNPCAEEVMYKDFNYRFYNLSIVGAVGETYWQKKNDRSELRVDLMDAGIIEDVVWEDTVIGEADFTEMEWQFSIEDESVAKIEGESLLERDFEYDYEKYPGIGNNIFDEYRHQSDPIIAVKLLKEGRTRMKITCGDYIKYTDIIVLPEHTDECGLYAMPDISDMEMLKTIAKYTETTYSGIYRDAYDFFNKEHLVLSAGDAFIRDLSAFSDMDKIEKLTFGKYTEDMFKQVTHINDIPELYSIEVYKSGADTTNGLYQYIDENITDVKGTGWVTIDEGNHINSRLLDINDDERISVRDALLVLMSSAELLELDVRHEKIADVNEDSLVSAEDALDILKIIAKIK